MNPTENKNGFPSFEDYLRDNPWANDKLDTLIMLLAERITNSAVGQATENNMNYSNHQGALNSTKKRNRD